MTWITMVLDLVAVLLIGCAVLGGVILYDIRRILTRLSDLGIEDVLEPPEPEQIDGVNLHQDFFLAPTTATARDTGR